MLTHAPSPLGSTAALPWSNVYGVARSLLALGLLLTLACTSTEVLFDPAHLESVARTSALASRGNLFILLREHLTLARVASIVILAAAASGWRPRFTALPHWWVAVSFGSGCRIPDGGDHIHVVLSTLLLGVSLTDARVWHWKRAAIEEEASGASSPSFRQEAAAFVAKSFLVMAAVQMVVVYFHASVGKMPVRDWANGTAVYYWFTDPEMGAPDWLVALLQPVLTRPLGVLALTWGTMALELALCFGALLQRRARLWLLLAGLGFHLGIVFVHGLVSFFFSMAAGLVLLLRRWDEPFKLPAFAPRVVSAWLQRPREVVAFWRAPLDNVGHGEPQRPC